VSTFQVNDMTCGHCASTITKALRVLDPEAKVSIDLNTRRVDVENARASAAQLQGALEEAGYTPAVVEPGGNAGASRKGGCGCGCG